MSAHDELPRLADVSFSMFRKKTVPCGVEDEIGTLVSDDARDFGKPLVPAGGDGQPEQRGGDGSGARGRGVVANMLRGDREQLRRSSLTAA